MAQKDGMRTACAFAAAHGHDHHLLGWRHCVQLRKVRRHVRAALRRPQVVHSAQKLQQRRQHLAMATHPYITIPQR